MLIPFRPAGEADMRSRPDGDRAIDTPGRHDHQSTTRPNCWKSRPAFHAEALFVPGSGNPECPDAILTGKPPHRRGRREQVGRMGRPRVLSTTLAVTQKEAFEFTGDLKFDGTAQTGAGSGRGHVDILMFVLTRKRAHGSISPDKVGLPGRQSKRMKRPSNR